LPIGQTGADVLEDVVGHFHLLPGADAGGDGEGPEDEETHRADRGFVDPFAGADLYKQAIIFTSMEDVAIPT